MSRTRRAGACALLASASALLASACAPSGKTVTPSTATSSAATPSDRDLADAVLLVPADLPGWQALPPSPADSSLWEQLAVCAGGRAAHAALGLTVSSPEFVQGATDVTSHVTVLRSPADAAAAAPGIRLAKVQACATAVLSPSVEAGLPTGSVVSDVAATSLAVPGVVRTGFAWRFTMDIAVPQQGSVHVVEDLVGAVVGRMEVDVVVTQSDGSPPDPSVETRLAGLVTARARRVGP